MQKPDKVTEYLETVGQQIRWKRAQASVLEEIENHITDQKNAFITAGYDEEKATNMAIAEMGDPIVVGEELDRTHRPKPDWPLLFMTATMLLLGLAIQFFIGSHIPLGAWMFGRQIVWAGISLLLMFAAYFLDFTIIGKYPKFVFLALCTITLASYLFTGGGRGTSTIYLLLLFPTAFAGFVYSIRNKGCSGLILCGAAFIIPVYLTVIINNLTVLVLLLTSCFIVLTAAVMKNWFNAGKLLAALILAVQILAALCTPFILKMAGKQYIWDKLLAALNPSLDPDGYGYISSLIQRLLSHSLLIGQGLPIADVDYSVFRILPGANTDFLLTCLIYRFGWIVLIGIIAIFSVFIMRAIILCKKQKSVLGFLVSLAIISTFALQFLVYIAANLGFWRLDPMPLPLISYGGRALVINMFLIGFLLSVFRTGDLVRDKARVSAAKFIQFNKGQIIIDLKNDFIK
ncbi:FtsW/RodA/SpoVE family cell cycle protein [Desulfosporosinus youngiae]|uniref:Bacterial cell division membrane protein n=1 Tax=Desulfosporosinus youngiae DSM 17734 TaxID=768710 RepID=H5Y5L7_9FIRM|nr:FtsW/RodA/SpoVE family cell cycle protein [Desulfosporosinus youngiae]EHQ90604.1 bacterial cell division membrane protein [Desulfosporosinus youngiae DSM 17734]